MTSQIRFGGAGALARDPTPWSGLIVDPGRTRASGAVQGDRPTCGAALR
jgi:hypothetical protein